MPEARELTNRQRELVQAFVVAWEASAPAPPRQPFVLGSGPMEHPNWPSDVAVPEREEVRTLVHLDLLTADRSRLPDWVVFPSPRARELFAHDHDDLTGALSDVDRRLGIILEATVAAHEADPSEPLHFASMDQLDYIHHAHWPIERDVVRRHDLAQLEDLGLVATAPAGTSDLKFWPTPLGRQAVRNPASLLEERASTAVEPTERSRLQQWSERFRAGEFAVSTAAGTASGMLIRALLGQ